MKIPESAEFIHPDWPAPKNVRSISTTRIGGFSEGVYKANNLALHVGDDSHVVERNRQRLKTLCHLPAEPAWLTQTHSNIIVNSNEALCEADASYSEQKHQVCVVMTADCLPILLCDQSGQQVAAVHAGWRGLLNNVIENSLACFSGSSKNILAWLGPAIGKDVFEVGSEVYDVFVERHSEAANLFQLKENNKYLADMVGLAKLRLNLAGVTAIYGGQYCTCSDEERFFSYRRDGVCGRMASLIWLDK